MINDLTTDQLQLANFMSMISERCYAAEWMSNLEYVLWHTLTSGQRKYGRDFISTEDITTLKTYSYRIDGWIIFDKELEETFIGLANWKERFKIMTTQNPNLLT